MYFNQVPAVPFRQLDPIGFWSINPIHPIVETHQSNPSKSNPITSNPIRVQSNNTTGRRQRDSLLRGVRAEEIVISARRDQADLESLFRDVATRAVLHFIGDTEVGRPMTKEEDRADYWDIERLDQNSEEAGMISEDGRE